MELTHGIESQPHAAVLSIDHVHCWNTNLNKRNVVIDDIGFVLEKVPAVTELIGRLGNEVLKPTTGTGFARYIWVLIADHVEKKQSANAGDHSVGRKVLGQMTAPVETVVASERMDRLFQIGPDQPDLHPSLLASKCI